MRTTIAIAPPWSVLRPLQGAPPPGGKQRGFPVHADLADTLARAAPLDEPHPVARHVCAVLSSWAYSDAETVAMILSRLGLQDCRVRCVECANPAMRIRSTGFLVQSADGRVVLLAYRGTDPFDLSAWAVDADINHPTLLAAGDVPAGEGDAVVHAGFYRNQRATWYEVVGALQRALRGDGVLEPGEEARVCEGRAEPPAAPARRPLEALYVTGHSLGAAMATLAAFRIGKDDPALRRVLKQVYLFAPPMVGDAGFRAQWRRVRIAEGTTLDGRVFAHTYERDVVPHVPPRGATRYVHVGTHYRSAIDGKGGAAGAWLPGDAPEQCDVHDMARAVLPLFVGGHLAWRDLLGVLGLPLDALRALGSRPYSFADHIPTHYVVCSQPPGVKTEFGDDF